MAKRKKTHARPGKLKSAKQVSSPIATGGGGNVFEQHVSASMLALLLVRAIPPVLLDTVLERVDFQAERLGWNTDDVLLIGVRADGSERKLVLQVKRSFLVSQSDMECVKTITDFWKDFRNTGIFNADRDAFGLVVLQGSQALLGKLGGLLDCARISRDLAEFSARLATPGLMQAGTAKYAEELKAIVKSVPGITFSEEAFWRFLKALHLLSYDLTTTTRQTEAIIKTLLAHTAVVGDKLGAANATWAELLTVVGEGMPRAARYTIEDLPQSTRDRHSPLASSDHAALTKIQEHSSVTLKAIRTSLGSGISLARLDIVSQLITAIDEWPIVVVTGAAGVGKSALTKQAIAAFSGTPVVAFRAEEFAVPHLDQALQQAQIPVNAAGFTALYAARGRKILLIESVERLLEATTRDAFSDVLQLAASDRDWTVVLTCRDYSVETVQSSLLEELGVPTTVFNAPILASEEVDDVVRQIPALSRPASLTFLRRLFQNPYILDKAARMSWPAEGPLPGDERAFRERYWRELLRRDDYASAGMPARREEVFVTICLRRARALQPHARCDDLDQEALSALHRDGIVEFADSSHALAAPSHDVLEDWAIMFWLRKQFDLAQGDIAVFANSVGTYPALRRTYRRWIGEQLLLEPKSGDSLVLNVIVNPTIPQHFKDDTIVAALLADSATDFLGRIPSTLRSSGYALLKRVIHLLRVACKSKPAWAPGSAVSLFFVPSGNAWPAILQIVRENINELKRESLNLIVGLLSDWSAGVSYDVPYPPGAADAAFIAHELLPELDSYNTTDLLKTVLEVLIKIPLGDEGRFRDLLKRSGKADHSDGVAEALIELLLPGLDCIPSCRDVPDAVATFAQDCLLKACDETSGSFSHEVSDSFGIEEHIRANFLPPSALRGVFLPLLQRNPKVGLSLIINLVNHAGHCYSSQRRLEPAPDIALTLPTGESVKQACNWRLWVLYRGASVGPYALQTALMALESWLLKRCESNPDSVDEQLLTLLRSTNNVMITGVVASVATAHPQLAQQTGLALLTRPALIRLDLSRRAREPSDPSLVMGLFGLNRDPVEKLYVKERKQSSNLPHRRRDLESVALMLQLTPQKPKVERILDDYRAALPPENQQQEDDHIWRLALHRMDLRNFVAESTSVEGQNDASDKATVLLRPKQPDADLLPMIEEAAQEHQQFGKGLSLFVWGTKAWEREAGSGQEWQERLKEARSAEAAAIVPGDIMAAREGPGYVAAVCVRDRWTEMDPDSRSWCVETLIGAVKRDSKKDELFHYQSSGAFSSPNACVVMLAAAISFGLDRSVEAEVKNTLLLALTHPVEAVVKNAAFGVGYWLSSTNREFGSSGFRVGTWGSAPNPGV